MLKFRIRFSEDEAGIMHSEQALFQSLGQVIYLSLHTCKIIQLLPRPLTYWTLSFCSKTHSRGMCHFDQIYTGYKSSSRIFSNETTSQPPLPPSCFQQAHKLFSGILSKRKTLHITSYYRPDILCLFVFKIAFLQIFYNIQR